MPFGASRDFEGLGPYPGRTRSTSPDQAASAIRDSVRTDPMAPRRLDSRWSSNVSMSIPAPNRSRNDEG